MRQLDALDVAAELDRGLEGETPVILLEMGNLSNTLTSIFDRLMIN